jgi:hypothetical protein
LFHAVGFWRRPELTQPDSRIAYSRVGIQ